MAELQLPENDRVEIWHEVGRAIESYLRDLETLPVAPSADPEVARTVLRDVDFSEPMSAKDAIALCVEGLRKHQVHNGHPRYFGLFNPASTTMGIAADALVAGFNPQLAAWTHAPFACEVEQLLVREIGGLFGYPKATLGGSFTSGGAEANHSALLMSLVHARPEFSTEGARTFRGRPRLYVSTESHHSFLKAASLCGIGSDALRTVPTDDRFLMDPKALKEAIREDKRCGDIPFLVVATLGSTGSGLVDPIGDIAEVGSDEGLWVHADAAYGGAVIFAPELKEILQGIERADSITFDTHKWPSMPMAAGMCFTRHPELLERTFSVTADYMPTAKDEVEVVEPHRTSMQWTRRFIGLKLFLTLLVTGYSGYGRTVRRMVDLGESLRRKLRRNGYRIVNETSLPVVNFQDERHPEGASMAYLNSVASRIADSGDSWISVTSLGGRIPALRACISNFRNREEDLDALIEILLRVRKA